MKSFDMEFIELTTRVGLTLINEQFAYSYMQEADVWFSVGSDNLETMACGIYSFTLYMKIHTYKRHYVPGQHIVVVVVVLVPRSTQPNPS